MSTPSAAAWDAAGAGYAEFAAAFQPAVGQLLATLAVPRGARVLDVATGTGLAALAAARQGARVVGVDFAPSLVAEARRLTRLEPGLDAAFVVGDAERLPVRDGAFDAAISSFGIVFARDHAAVIAELTRVLRPGGRLAFTAWMPAEPHQSLLTLTSPWLPPPPPGPGLFDWGCEPYVRERLAGAFDDLAFHTGNAPWGVASPSDAFAILFERGLGPTIAAWRAFDLPTKLAVRDRALRLFVHCMQPDGSVRIDRPWLLVSATRRG